MADARETLAYSLARQRQLLEKVRRGIADVTRARERLEERMAVPRRWEATARQLAEDADSLGRNDLGLEADLLQLEARKKLAELKPAHDALLAEEAKLTQAAERLQAGIDKFERRYLRLLQPRHLSR